MDLNEEQRENCILGDIQNHNEYTSKQPDLISSALSEHRFRRETPGFPSNLNYNSGILWCLGVGGFFNIGLIALKNGMPDLYNTRQVTPVPTQTHELFIFHLP